MVLDQPSGLASKKSYEELAEQILVQGADGVVCYQDYTALGLILELLNRGVRVPSDVAITGFDNLPIGKAYSIGVTTYAFSAESVRGTPRGSSGRVRGQRRASREGPDPGELIVRESSGLVQEILAVGKVSDGAARSPAREPDAGRSSLAGDLRSGTRAGSETTAVNIL